MRGKGIEPFDRLQGRAHTRGRSVVTRLTRAMRFVELMPLNGAPRLPGNAADGDRKLADGLSESR
jgi:hypothetical protein